MKAAERLRERLLDTRSRRLLVSRLKGSAQEADITGGINCGGLGRIRSTDSVSSSWPFDTTIPNEPAASKLGISQDETRLSQLFQLAGCNYRCWFCYVATDMLVADPNSSEMVSPDELISMYAAEPFHAPILTLTGGQPDLVPEWLPWTMKALVDHGLDQQTYLWMDDNLSTDFAWRFLGESDWDLIRSYRNFGKVACLKSFSPAGFYENTGAGPEWFEFQLALFKRLFVSGIDLYGYIILGVSDMSELRHLPGFMDRLQRDVHENILLRIVPLELKVYGPTEGRLNSSHRATLENQYRVLEAWNDEIGRRYSSRMIELPLSQVPLD